VLLIFGNASWLGRDVQGNVTEYHWQIRGILSTHYFYRLWSSNTWYGTASIQ